MSELIRLFVWNTLIGFAAAIVFVGCTLLLDLWGLGTLIAGSDIAGMAMFVLTFQVGLTFASIQIGIAVMSGEGMGGR